MKSILISLTIIFISSSYALFGSNKVELADSSVSDRGLVTTKPKYQSIIKENEKYSEPDKIIKHSPGVTLGYVTPWNNHGYDTAKWFNQKLDLVAPTWFQVKLQTSQGGVRVLVNGDHDVDSGWIKDVKSSNGGPKIPKIVPRYTLETNKEMFAAVVNSPELCSAIAMQIVGSAKKHDFDGVVFEFGYVGMRAPDASTEKNIVEFIKKIGYYLHQQKLIFILVIPAARPGMDQLFTSEDFLSVVEDVDYFSLMTYDFSREVGPNSPLNWITSAIYHLIPPEKRSDNAIMSKVLMGIPFYGYKWEKNGQSSAVLGKQYLDILKKEKSNPIWEESSHEHYISTDLGDGRVYYPSLQSLKDRIQLAEDLGVGISIWELGQGFDYFYDLL